MTEQQQSAAISDEREALWDAFIALLNKEQPLPDGKPHVNFIGSIASHKALFLRASVPLAQASDTAEMDLSALNELAKAYAASYASPHHITFSVEGLRNLLAAAQQQKELP